MTDQQAAAPARYWQHDCADERGSWRVAVAEGEPCPFCWRREVDADAGEPMANDG